jgi:integrase
MNMGRKRKHNTDMPARVYLSRGWWFFTPKGSPKIKLAGEQDRAGALRAYAELMDGRPRSGTVAELLNRYARDVLPGKSVRTRKEQERQIHKINAVFGTMRIPDITPPMIAQYLDANPAKVAANREMALLSHAYTKAIRWGLASVNPCRGVERNTERPRDRYITHEEFTAVLESAPASVAVMMALAYLTGQREGDLLRLRRDAITADGLQVQQRKTGKRLLIHWTPALRWAIEQAGTLPAEGRASLWIVAQRDGSPYSESGFQTAWQKHIRKCHEQGVIAERFTFHDLRAKAGSDVKDGRLLGHMDPRTLRRVYLRKPEKVSPVN